MKLNWWSISFFFAAIVLGMLLMKSCQNSNAQENRYEDSIKRRDSVIHTLEKKGLQVQKFTDSVFGKSLIDSAKARHSNDSLKSVISALRGSLTVAKDSAWRLWRQLKVFYLSGDTADLRVAYYALRDELDSTNNLMVAIQFQHERVEYNLRSEVDSAYGVIHTLHTQMDVLKKLLDQQTQISESANKEEGKIIAAKRKNKILEIIAKVGIGIVGIFIGSKL